MDKKFNLTLDQIDIINSITDENVKLKVIEQFTNFNIRLSEEETKRNEHNKNFGSKFFDLMSSVALSFVENSDKIVEVAKYAEHIKHEYDKKYHPENVSIPESPEMEIVR